MRKEANRGWEAGKLRGRKQKRFGAESKEKLSGWKEGKLEEKDIGGRKDRRLKGEKIKL